jgi:hypothetical protein
MKKTVGLLSSIAGVLVLAAQSAESAVLDLNHEPGRPVIDTDGNPPAFGGPTIADVDLPYEDLLFYIDVFSLQGTESVGDLFRFTVSIEDFVQIGTPIVSVSTAPNVSIFALSADEIEYEWSFEASDAVNTTLAAFSVPAGLIGMRPDDDLTDLNLAAVFASAGTSLGIWDPVGMTVTGTVEYDVQRVPLPASVFLLGGALAGLGVFKRKKGSVA